MNLQRELGQLEARVEKSRWKGHEHVQGYGVFALPMTSGHTLALRVFHVSDFAPYITVWHLDPEGNWSIYYNASRPDIACPRYFGAAAKLTAPANISLDWRGPAELHVQMDSPSLSWTVLVRETSVLRVLNAMSRRLPFWTWQRQSLLKPREWMSKRLGMGDITLAGVMPSSHFGTFMPGRIFYIDRSEAVLDGTDLGEPTRVRPNPKIGDAPLPARGVFAIGQAHWEIRDEEEYRRTRAELGVTAR